MSAPTTCGCDDCRRTVPAAPRWPVVVVLLVVAAVLTSGCSVRHRPCEDRVVIVVDT